MTGGILIIIAGFFLILGGSYITAASIDEEEPKFETTIEELHWHSDDLISMIEIGERKYSFEINTDHIVSIPDGYTQKDMVLKLTDLKMGQQVYIPVGRVLEHRKQVN